MPLPANRPPGLLRLLKGCGKTRATFFYIFRDTANLEYAITVPCRWLIELDASHQNPHPTSSAETRGTHIFALSITSRSAYQLPVAYILARRFNRLGWLGPDQVSGFESCLHEALINAVVHGNLEIAGGFNGNDAFAAFYDSIQSKLHTPEYGERRIYIILSHVRKRLYLRVSQSGVGHPENRQPDALDQQHGRGLSIIRHLTQGMQWHHHGRTLEMCFAKMPENPLVLRDPAP